MGAGAAVARARASSVGASGTWRRQRRVALASALGVMVASTLVGQLAADAAFPGDNGHIAVVTRAEDGITHAIQTVDPNVDIPSWETVVTDESLGLGDVAWSSDGTKVAFSMDGGDGNQDVFVANADGTGVVNVTADLPADASYGSPTWSPQGSQPAGDPAADSTQLAVVTTGAIWLVTVEGSAPSSQLHTGLEPEFRQPDWSPDGSALVVADGQHPDGGALWRVPVDGSSPVQLTDGAVQDKEPEWSPDGTQIAFTRSPDVEASQGTIHVMNADGTAVSDLAAEPGSVDRVAWAPDGSVIAFVDIVANRIAGVPPSGGTVQTVVEGPPDAVWLGGLDWQAVGANLGGDSVKLTPSDGVPGDRFGFSVAASSERVVAGAFGDDDLGEESGSAYVYEPDGMGGWAETKLTASDGAAFDWFGSAVATADDRVVIGAAGDDDLGDESGSVYVFEPDGTGGWAETKLTASDGAAFDGFGGAVAAAGDRVVVGARVGGAFDKPGSVYVYEPDGTGGWDETKLTTPDERRGFGISVAVDADRISVGVPEDDFDGTPGAAYVFDPDGTGGWNGTKLPRPDGASNAFGEPVAVATDLVVVVDPLGNFELGALHVFEPDSTGGWVDRELTASDGAFADVFGSSVAAAGRTIVAGANGDDIDGASSVGSAYVFEPNGVGGWGETKLTAPDGVAGDRFGWDVATAGRLVAVSALRDDDATPGAVYVFDLADSGQLTPSLTIEPAAGPAGTTFTSTGEGFSPDATATSYLQRPDGSEFDPLTLHTDSDGRFTQPHEIDSTGFDPGTYHHWVVDDTTGAVSNTVTFEVTVPTLTADPTSGPVGTTFSVIGTGFTPDGTADISLTGPADTETWTVAVDPDGGFTDTVDTDGDPPGFYRYDATDVTSGLTASVTFEVTTASGVTPPGEIVLVDGLAGADPADPFEDPEFDGVGGRVVGHGNLAGPQFTLDRPTVITEIGAFLHEIIWARTAPIELQLRPDLDGAPHPDRVLATLSVTWDRDGRTISFETTTRQVQLPAGTYYALFAGADPNPLGLLTGSVDLDGARVYTADAVTLGVILAGEDPTTTVAAAAVRVIGKPLPGG